jgi:hypothetical protein
MREYHTETGYYVLVNKDGDKVSKADVKPGKHPVSDDIDPNKSYDVSSQDELEAVELTGGDPEW